MRKLLAAALLGAVACGSGNNPNNPINPTYQPQIVNLTDSFSFQLTGVQNGSASLSYTWQNTGTQATIDRSSAITAGTVTLTFKDSVGVTVYTTPLNGQTGSVATSAGAAGAWTIVVDFANATGTINFRAQKL
jgi:outer membrane biogenesis lipoprotein LolB